MSKIIPTPKEQRTEPYWKELNKIIDPEVHIGIIDLGLVYQVNISNEGHAHVIMTLTSPGCPVGPILIQEVEDKMRMQPGVESVEVEIVWDPVWNQDFIDEDLREMMFGI
ncbi:metal-sulfur cluster assembly factor [Candidatus Peregrinibacteria bacterium]|nr:metal-sulfur cluster assembly factor [Candidatus Peregrinibacteria bacterium]